MKRLHKIKKQLRREARKSPRKGKEHSKWKKREKKRMGSHRRKKSRAHEMAAIAQDDGGGGEEAMQNLLPQPAASKLRKRSRGKEDAPVISPEDEHPQDPQQPQPPEPQLSTEATVTALTNSGRSPKIVVQTAPSLKVTQRELPTRDQKEFPISPRRGIAKSLDDAKEKAEGGKNKEK